jgi:hypothetical protein
MRMPAFLNDYLSIFQDLKYIDFKLVLSELNTPYMWAAIVASVFVLFITYASFRKHLFETSMDGAGVGFLVGIILTLAVQGILVYKFIGFKQLLSFIKKDSSSVISDKSDSGGNILGISDGCIPTSQNMEKFIAENVEESAKIKNILCGRQ